jgi:hypothetical protein
MRKIHKYRLTMEVGEAVAFELKLPKASELLYVAGQYGHVCVWASVDTETKETEVWTLYVVGTGCSVPPDTEHVGTAILHDGQLVAHVFILRTLQELKLSQR